MAADGMPHYIYNTSEISCTTMGMFISALLGLGSVILGSYAVFNILNGIIDLVYQIRNYGQGIVPLFVYIGMTFLIPVFAILIAYLLARGLSKGGKAMVVVLIMLTGFVGLLLFSNYHLGLQ
jgi:hypothetical protein